MKSVITYKGRYGATKQYAEWLGKELNIPVSPVENLDEEDLGKLDAVIIGTSVYIGKLEAGKWMRKNVHVLKRKKVFLFIVSGTPPNEREKLMEYVSGGVPKDLLENCHVSFLHGRMIYKNLGWRDKFMLKMGARLVRAKDPAEATQMITDFDDVKKENLTGLIELIKATELLIS